MSDQTKGLLITFFGVLFVVPDSLFVRLIPADPLTIAFWRVLLAGGGTAIWLLLRGGAAPFRAVLATGMYGWIYIVGVGASGVLFVIAVSLTSVANVVFIIASLPVFAAGGIDSAAGVAELLDKGASGVQVGTSYLLCTEARTSALQRELLRDVYRRVREQGYVLGNADITIIAQAPKMAPHIETMCQVIAQDLETELSNINVKATTTERLGFTGRKEGIATEAVVLLVKE